MRDRSRALAVFRRYLLNGAGFCLGLGVRLAKTGCLSFCSTSSRLAMERGRRLYFSPSTKDMKSLLPWLRFILLVVVLPNTIQRSFKSSSSHHRPTLLLSVHQSSVGFFFLEQTISKRFVYLLAIIKINTMKYVIQMTTLCVCLSFVNNERHWNEVTQPLKRVLLSATCVNCFFCFSFSCLSIGVESTTGRSVLQHPPVLYLLLLVPFAAATAPPPFLFIVFLLLRFSPPPPLHYLRLKVSFLLIHLPPTPSGQTISSSDARTHTRPTTGRMMVNCQSWGSSLRQLTWHFPHCSKPHRPCCSCSSLAFWWVQYIIFFYWSTCWKVNDIVVKITSSVITILSHEIFEYWGPINEENK